MQSLSNSRFTSFRAPMLWLWIPWSVGYCVMVWAEVDPTGFAFWSVTVAVLALSTFSSFQIFGKRWSHLLWRISFCVAALFLSMAWWNLRILPDSTSSLWKGAPPREVHLNLEVVKVDRTPTPGQAGLAEFSANTVDAIGTTWFKKMPTSMDCRLYTFEESGFLRKGDQIEVRGVLYPPNSLLQRRFVLRQGAILSIEHREESWGLNLLRPILLARMTQALEAGAPEGKPYSRYIQSMLTGDKRYLQYRDKQRFRDAGIMHFFAISGFHLSIVAAICFSFLQLIGMGKRWSSTWMLVFCAGYVWLTGYPVSAQRALLMMAVYFAGRWCRRKPDALAATVLAGWLILMIAPQQLFEPGYQLSFVVVIGILTQALPLHASLSDGCKKRFQWVEEPTTLLQKTMVLCREYFIGSFAVSWCAFWLSAPIVAAYFGKVPFVAILLNTLLAPLFALTMLTGFLSAMAGLFGLLWVSTFLNHAVWMELSAVDALIRLGDSLHLTWNHGSTALPSTIAVVVMLGIGILWNLQGAKSRYLFFLIPVISLSSILF